MFTYLVALVAAIFIIFGLLHARCLNDWLRSSIRYSLTFYNGLIRRPVIDASLNNESLENTFTLERPVIVTNERTEYEDFPARKIAFNDKERLSDALLEEAGIKSKSLNPPRYSLEDILPDERDKDLGLPVMRTLRLGTTKDNVIKTLKQEGKENIFESLKSSIERTYPSSRLSTRQMYNLISNETTKENEAKQNLIDSDKSKFNESLSVETWEHLPSSSENKSEREDNINK